MRGFIKVGAAVAVGLAAGCSRQHFRERADKDVEGVITQKNVLPDAKVENWHAYPDPRARFGDFPGSSPDFPPFPPDDPAAYQLSPNPQRPGRGGAGRYEGDGYLAQMTAWDAENRAEDAAVAAQAATAAGDAPKMPDPNAAANQAVGGFAATFVTTQPALKLRLDQAVELAIFNSREFQDRREDLYLAALPVTLERFTFAAQAFASLSAIRDSVGRDAAAGSNRWQINPEAGFRRTFATGGELVVRLANQIVFDLSSGRPDVAIGNVGITLTQPLLRGAGLAVTLENLTQAERTLLYAIRSYARFRRVFYVAIAGQGDYTNNPYGLQGLAANLGRGVGANLTASRNGYLPTILRAATLANQRKNVVALEGVLNLFQNLKEGGGVNELQVVRVEQNLLTSRTDVLQATRQYNDNLDLFKLQLGVPATLAIELDDAPLRPIRQQLQRFDQVYDQLRALEAAAGKFDPAEPVERYRERWRDLLTTAPLVRGTRFAQDEARVAADARALTNDDLAGRIRTTLALRRRLLDARADRQLKGQPETPAQGQELINLDFTLDRLQFEQALRRYEARGWMRLPAERRSVEQAVAFRAAFESGMLIAIQPRNERLTAIKRDWPPLPPIVIDGTDVIRAPLDEANVKVAQTALTNRLDLTNARAQVVDGWRQVTVRANSLQGALDVQYDLSTASLAGENEPFGLGGSRSRSTLTLRYDAPFVRRAERNAYRTALIAYQRSRRNLMAFEDNVITDARTDLRQLRQLSVAYEYQQRAVDLAYAQVDNARSTFVAPPDPTARDSAGNVAALTQQLLEAQSQLVRAQNDLYTSWVNYLAFRMELFLDLELFPLDPRGVWLDEPPAARQPPEQPAPDPAPGGPERVPAPRPAGEK